MTTTTTEPTATTASKTRKETRSDIRCTPEAKTQFDELYAAAKADGTFTGLKQEFLGFILAQYKNLPKAEMNSSKPSITTDEDVLNCYGQSTDSYGQILDFNLAKCYRKSLDVDFLNCYGDDKPQAWFTNISGNTKAEREEKYQEIKEALGIEGDIISMSRNELFAKAAELSGKSIEEIIKSGAESEAQSIITAMRKPAVSGQGRGRLGAADVALDEAFIEIVGMLENDSYRPKDGLPITKISSRAGANFNSAKAWAVRRGFEFPMGKELAIKLAKELPAR